MHFALPFGQHGKPWMSGCERFQGVEVSRGRDERRLMHPRTLWLVCNAGKTYFWDNWGEYGPHGFLVNRKNWISRARSVRLLNNSETIKIFLIDSGKFRFLGISKNFYHRDSFFFDLFSKFWKRKITREKLVVIGIIRTNWGLKKWFEILKN